MSQAKAPPSDQLGLFEAESVRGVNQCAGCRHAMDNREYCIIGKMQYQPGQCGWRQEYKVKSPALPEKPALDEWHDADGKLLIW